MTIRNNWTPKDIYLYLVRLVMLTMGVFATASLVRSAVDIVSPQPALLAAPSLRTAPDGSPPDPAAVEREEAYQREASRRNAILNLAANATLVLLAASVYYIYWLKTGPDTPPKRVFRTKTEA